jgi:hypothetical protein
VSAQRMEHEPMGYWGLVPASVLYRRQPRTAAHELLDLGWWGVNAVAPSITSLAGGEAPPALPNLPAPPGKVPTTDDPRIAGAMGEAANIGMALMSIPGVGVATGAGRLLPGLMRRSLQMGEMPIADSLASRNASLFDPPVKSQLPISAQYPRGVPTDATDDSPTTTKDESSSPNTLSAEERWAERMKPSRQRNLTPSQRKLLADDLRSLRRLRSQGEP